MTSKKLQLTRRQMLGLMGGSALAIVVGCSDDDDSTGATATRSPAASGTATGTPAATATPTLESSSYAGSYTIMD